MLRYVLPCRAVPLVVNASFDRLVCQGLFFPRMLESCRRPQRASHSGIVDSVAGLRGRTRTSFWHWKRNGARSAIPQNLDSFSHGKVTAQRYEDR